MSEDVAARLRQLAHDHHDGRLDLRAYRSLRAPLLDALVPSAVIAVPALEVTQPRAVPAAAVVKPVIEPKKSSRGFPVGVTAIVVVVLAVAAAAFWVLRENPSGGGGNAPSAQGVATGPDRVLDLVGPFMDRADWSDGRLTALNASLLELGGAQIGAVASEARFQRFVDELRLRLKEQQALSAVRLTADNSPLAALAVTVGIDLNSPDAALHITALPPAPPAEEGPGGARAEGGGVATARRGSEHAATPGGAGAATGAAAGAKTVSRDSQIQTGAEQNNTSDVARGAGPYAAGGAVAGSAPNAGTSVVAGTTNGTASGSTNGAAPNAATSNNAATADSRETTCRLDLIGSRRPLCHDTVGEGADGPLLALVPSGAFEMGSTAAPEEQPVHHVTIREPFAISVYEVSQGEFKQYCERAKRPCAAQPWSGDDYPVVNVSWDDARAYTEWLSGVTHHHYSLPTEAQWEYAARAGRTGLYPSGDALSPTDAQFSASAKQTSAARRGQAFSANPFRLLHTVGNVREWVEDTWTQSFAAAPNDGSAVKSAQQPLHVVRGGSYADGAARLRLSLRESLPLSTRDTTTGFRIVRELP